MSTIVASLVINYQKRCDRKIRNGNWKKSEMKQTWLILSYYSGTFLEGKMVTTKKSTRLASLLANNEIGGLSNKTEEHYSLHSGTCDQKLITISTNTRYNSPSPSYFATDSQSVSPSWH
jgi:hypothetical protein